MHASGLQTAADCESQVNSSNDMSPHRRDLTSAQESKNLYDMKLFADVNRLKKKWSGQQDLNLRPLSPEPSALPG